MGAEWDGDAFLDTQLSGTRGKGVPEWKQTWLKGKREEALRQETEENRRERDEEYLLVCTVRLGHHFQSADQRDSFVPVVHDALRRNGCDATVFRVDVMTRSEQSVSVLSTSHLGEREGARGDVKIVIDPFPESAGAKIIADLCEFIEEHGKVVPGVGNVFVRIIKRKHIYEKF